MAIKTYTFTRAELAVLIQHMTGDARSLDQVAQADLSTDAEQLSLAEENLLERGLLVHAPLEEENGVASEIATVLATTLSPDMLCVLRAMRRNNAVPLMYFSFTSECIARNYVDAQGQHVFAELANLDEALNEILSASGVQPSQSIRQIDAAQPLERLLRDSETLTLLMVVAEPAQPRPPVHNLSWLEARGSVWLVDASTGSDTPYARPVDLASLRQVIETTLASDNPYRF